MNSSFLNKYRKGKSIYKGKVLVDSEKLESLIPHKNFDDIFISNNPNLKSLNVQKFNYNDEVSIFKKEEKLLFLYNHSEITIDFKKNSEKSSEEYIFDLLNSIYATNWDQVEELKINRESFFSKVIFSSETVLHLKVVDDQILLFLNRKKLDKFEMSLPTIMAYSTFLKKFKMANFIDDLVVTMRLLEVLK